MLTRSKNEKLYMQLYHYYKDLILNEKMTEGMKMPSIRKCAVQFDISCTTAEMAYMLLAADGYIISKPQSGYYVTGMGLHQKKKDAENGVNESGTGRNSGTKNRRGENRGIPSEETGSNLYRKNVVHTDFSRTSGGQESFNLELWRRYMKSALRQSERMITYGNPQGEEDLRQVLSLYLTQNRNVICKPENLVIGAGFQSLLHILCPLIRDKKEICFMDPNFSQGHAIFEDYGFILKNTEDCKRKIWQGEADADLYYITPSHMNRWGDVLPVEARFQLLHQIAKVKGILIEDDYDSEFAYWSHPTPALQGLDGGKNVVYISTFSRILLPSIRISFMILPDCLLERYQERKDLYNQTVSKADQIALCQYIRDGHLQYQIRKTRKKYEKISSSFMESVKRLLQEKKNRLEIVPGTSGMIVKVKLPEGCSARQLHDDLLQEGIHIGLLTGGENSSDIDRGIYLSCNGVNESKWEECLSCIEKFINRSVTAS